MKRDLEVIRRSKGLKLCQEWEFRWTRNQKLEFIKTAMLSKQYRRASYKSPWLDECLDQVLGLNELGIQKNISRRDYGSETIYPDHPPELLFTPYAVVYEIALKCQSESNWVDLGSGLGRLGFALKALDPSCKFTGYEWVSERVNQSQRTQKKLGLKNCRFLRQDLSKANFNLPLTDYYFLFNPFSPRTLQKITAKILSNLEKNKSAKVIVVDIGKTGGYWKRLGLKISAHKKIKPWPGQGFKIYQLNDV